MFSYNFSADQEARMKALLARNGRTSKTPNEKAYQIVERGLGTLELQYKNRERVQYLTGLGRLKEKEENEGRPTKAPVATITTHKGR